MTLTSIPKKPFYTYYLAYFARGAFKVMDRAGHDYWAQGWDGAPVPPLHDLDTPGIRNWIDCQYFNIFKKVLRKGDGQSVIEIGCGNSIWLAYFKKYFDAAVCGLDYTETGCRTARAILERYGLEADVIEGDLFAPPANLRDRFDIVFTNGVVEHFENTADCISHCAAFARPGGVIVTFIPNLKGWMGAVQKRLDRKIYDVHVPLNLEDIRTAHTKAGLEIMEAGYLMPLNLYMLNPARLKDNPGYFFIRAFIALVTKTAWVLEMCGLRLPRNRALSSHIYVLARRTV
ncbi:MAG: class I SAM-dependent methyltransferase [Alphaproteobacteria bacterium]|nr:class I SAM-dependent methyltransferase [Alphaproteobacteria bacterium]